MIFSHERKLINSRRIIRDVHTNNILKTIEDLIMSLAELPTLSIYYQQLLFLIGTNSLLGISRTHNNVTLLQCK